MPLFKTIIEQTGNKRNEEIMNRIVNKYYKNSNKPLGNNPEKTNYNEKIRNNNMKEIFGKSIFIYY